MKIHHESDRAVWNQWFASRMYAEFLQFFEWGEFQKSMGIETVRERFIENGEVRGQVQAFLQSLPFGMRYAYAPRCDMSNDAFALFCDDMRLRGCVFARVEPIREVAVSLPSHTVSSRQPQNTLIIDLSQTEEALLSRMHQKTRYNIHLAQKRGVRIAEEKNADIFWKLLKETSSRDAFRTHPRAYYEAMLACPLAHQLTAYDGATPIASNILVCAGDTMTYLHGASRSRERNMMAPYLLQFSGMQLGKKLGCRFYDFWGVAPQASSGVSASFHGYAWDPSHPWSGITRFKAGFGGMSKPYPHAFEVVFRPILFRAYRFARRAWGIAGK